MILSLSYKNCYICIFLTLNLVSKCTNKFSKLTMDFLIGNNFYSLIVWAKMFWSVHPTVFLRQTICRKKGFFFCLKMEFYSFLFFFFFFFFFLSSNVHDSSCSVFSFMWKCSEIFSFRYFNSFAYTLHWFFFSFEKTILFFKLLNSQPSPTLT